MSIAAYIAAVQSEAARGNATEHTYRERYAELLKIDFPRLPLPPLSSPASGGNEGGVALFADLATLGAELVDLHLLRLPGALPAGAVGGAGGAAALRHLRTSFPIDGSSRVQQVRYSESELRVYINKAQYFEGIAPETWTFRVGGYQVLDKWLKDRKGRALSFDDLLRYHRVVVALAETRSLMAAIDVRIPGWPIV